MSALPTERVRELVDAVRYAILSGAPLSEQNLSYLSAALPELLAYREPQHHLDPKAVYGEHLIPVGMRESLDAYVMHGQPPGDTLRAILASNLREAFRRADVATARGMPAIAAYLYNRCPASCHGSEARVATWLAMHAASRAWSACLADMAEHFDTVKLEAASGHETPVLTSPLGPPLVGRFVGVHRKDDKADGLRFQLAVEWKPEEPTRPFPDLWVSLAPGHTYKLVIDEDSDRCVGLPDASNVITVYEHCLELP